VSEQVNGASLRRSRRELIRATGIVIVLYAVTAYMVWTWMPRWPVSVMLAVHAVTLVTSTAVLTWHLVSIPEYRRTIAFEVEQGETKRRLVAEADRRDFGTRFSRAMDHVDDEAAALNVVERALDLVVGTRPAQLMLADSSRSHLKTRASVGLDDNMRCEVPSPHACPSLREGRTLVFESSKDLDACPHLMDRSAESCSAVCVPVNVMGESIGVVHTTNVEGHIVLGETVESLETIARTAGARISMLRVFAETLVQAATDPLTGLMNRRSIEREFRLLMRSGTRFSVVLADLDHFKSINDTHGHETGDRALRVFSDVLRTSLRPDDALCRYGGEEFLMLMPATTPDEAMWALGRVREDLVLRLTSAEVPQFTASFGVAEWSPGFTSQAVLALADEALLAAKGAGRNRVVIAGTDTPTPKRATTPNGATTSQSATTPNGATTPESSATARPDTSAEP